MSDIASSGVSVLSSGRRHRAGWLALGGALTVAGLALAAWMIRDRVPDPAGLPAVASTGSADPAGLQAAGIATSADLPPIAASSSGRSRTELRRQAERNPRDGRAWALVAYAELDADQFAAAAAAFEKAVAVSTKVAMDPGVLCDWAEALGMAQGGHLDGRPAELVAQALLLRPNHPKALEMSGSAAYEKRDYARAAAYWRRLQPLLPAGAAEAPALANAIARAERLAATSLPAAR